MKTLLLISLLCFTHLASAQNTSLKQYFPECKKTLLENTYYTDCFDNEMHTASWVGWVITKEHIQNVATRSNNFRQDPRCKSVKPTEYINTGYDRGHLAPCQDFDWNQQAEDETFLMSNIAPQNPRLNRGVWKVLEEKCRKWATDYDSVLVLCGAIFDSRQRPAAEMLMPVPDNFWKAVLFKKDGQWVMSAWVFVNFQPYLTTPYLHYAQYQITVDKLEEWLKLDLFAALPDEIEAKLENTLDQH